MRARISEITDIEAILTAEEAKQCSSKEIMCEAVVQLCSGEKLAPRILEIKVGGCRGKLHMLISYPKKVAFEQVKRYELMLSMTGYNIFMETGAFIDRNLFGAKIEVFTERHYQTR